MEEQYSKDVPYGKKQNVKGKAKNANPALQQYVHLACKGHYFEQTIQKWFQNCLSLFT